MPVLPYHESSPPPSLASWVDAFWHSTIEHDGILRLLPSANMQLLAYTNASGSGLAIVGPMAKFQMTHVHNVDKFFGARLHVGVKIAIESSPSIGKKDTTIFGSDVICQPVQAFESAFAKTAHAVRFDLLTQLIHDLAEQKYLARDPLVDKFIEQALGKKGNISVEQLVAKIPLSERQLRRRFEAQTQMTPKLFLKICRQQAAIEKLKQSAGTMAAIAAAYGYSDQAHFTNEFRKLIGTTPLTLDDELTLQ